MTYNEKLQTLALTIQEECEKEKEPVTKEEALEMAKMELNAKENCKRYETSAKERKTTNRTRKIDSDKKYLLSYLEKSIEENQKIKITNIKNETEISFTYNEEQYTVKLIKHRKK